METRMLINKLQTRSFRDIFEHLHSPEKVILYLDACIESDKFAVSGM